MDKLQFKMPERIKDILEKERFQEPKEYLIEKGYANIRGIGWVNALRFQELINKNMVECKDKTWGFTENIKGFDINSIWKWLNNDADRYYAITNLVKKNGL